MNECVRLGRHAIRWGDTPLCCETPERVAGLLSGSARELSEPDKRANAHPALGTTPDIQRQEQHP